jgi:hypothetical protein
MIRWEGLDPATVERAIKMLIRRLHSTAQGIDGSGGDGGRDVRWDSPDGLVIFEVKSYAGRLTNGQKRKIEASLARALAHAPVRWVLVLPLDPSPAEESWFDGRRARYSGIVLEWRGRDWLDGQFAAHQDLRRYVEGCNYELLERARELGHEQAALVNGSADLAARVNGLVHGRARELSPYWQVDVATEGDATTLRYSAHVPDAATLDPVMLVPRFTFPADDPDAGDALRQLTLAFDYGAGAVVDGRPAGPPSAGQGSGSARSTPGWPPTVTNSAWTPRWTPTRCADPTSPTRSKTGTTLDSSRNRLVTTTPAPRRSIPACPRTTAPARCGESWTPPSRRR